MILIVSGGKDLTSLFSVYSFAPLEFCTGYMYCLSSKINKIRVKCLVFVKTNLFVLGM